MHDCSLLFAFLWFIFKLQQWKTHARLFAIVRSFHASFSSSLADYTSRGSQEEKWNLDPYRDRGKCRPFVKK